MIRKNVLPHIFFGKMKTLSPIVGDLCTIPAKKARLGLLNPVTPENKKYLRSQRGSVELVRAMTGGGVFSNTDHLWALIKERRDRKKDRDAVYETKLKGLVCDLKGTRNRLILRAKSTSG